MLRRLAMEPPFRIIVRALMKYMPVSLETRVRWELSKRPAYLLGVYQAAMQARSQKVSAISVVEFGVAGGEGLLSLQDDAEAVEQATGVAIKVFGFDAGALGLPPGTGDYRDHPDAWRAGDYPMDEPALRSRLTRRTTLIVGDVRQTVPRFFPDYAPPSLGFVAIDLDLYSSTRDALQIFTSPDRKMLWHVPLYFDDVDFVFNHRFAGELLAIDEFNADSDAVKIDRWYGVRDGRPFPERGYCDKMFVAHDLEAVSSASLSRSPGQLPLGGHRLHARTPSRI
jgi:hypothetical protein